MSLDFNKMTVAQLKGELKSRNLPFDGKKSEMVARLEDHQKELENEIDEMTQGTEETTEENAENGTEEDQGGEEVKQEEEEMEHADTEETPVTTQEGDDGEEKPEGEKEEEEEEENKAEDQEAEEGGEESEEKAEEAKKEKKDEGPDYTKNAVGFVLALSSGRKIVIPSKETLKHDLKCNVQPKTVLVHPITLEDLANQTFHSYFEACVHFQVTFQEHSYEKPKSTKGYIEFMWASVEQATEQAELLSQIREDISIKHLTHADKKADVLQELPKEVVNYDMLLKKILYIGNLPPTATDQALHELFPDATRLAVVHNEEGLPKGYALAEMPNEEACDRATKMYMNVEFEGCTLVVMKAWHKVPKGLLDHDTRVDLLSKVKRCRVKLRSKVPVDMFTRRKLDNEMSLYKQRLDKDCKVREEMGLPVPPDVVRREELLKEIEEKKKEEGGDDDKKTTPKKTFSRNSNSIPYKRPVSGQAVRGRRGAPSLVRGGGRGGGYGQNYGGQGYGGSQGYSNQGYSNQSYSSGGGGGGSGSGGRGEYGQAVEMLMQVSKMLGRGQSSGQSQSFDSGYANSSGYGGTGYGSSSYGSSMGGGYGYGSGMQRGKRQAEDDGFGGGKRGPGYKGQRRW